MNKVSGSCRVCFLIAMVLVNCSPLRTAAQGHSLPWTGTWAVSPVRDDSGRTFHKQTLRQIVHTSVAGRLARIRFSNEFGSQAVTIADVHVAQRSTGSSIVAETDRQVRFDGVLSISIRPGLTAVSDPIAFSVPLLGDVTVSFYLPETTGPATFHPFGFQTNYIADGDISGSAALAEATQTESYYFLTNLDVQDQSTYGSIVAFGASITEGYASAPDSNRRWPNDLAEKLAKVGFDVGVLNQGISGNRLLSADEGKSAEARFDRDVLSQPGVHWVIFSDDPINDLGSTKPPPAADQLIAGIERLIVRAHEKQIKLFCSTLTPYQGAGYWTEMGEIAREQINAFIRGKTSGCDAVIDQDAATHDPSQPSRFLPAYDSGDHLHPNEAGLQAIANAVSLALFSQPTGDCLNGGTPRPVPHRTKQPGNDCPGSLRRMLRRVN